MPQAAALPAEHFQLFLAVRRGLPLLGAALLALLALLEPVGRGWWVLGAVALLAEVWPTFKRGKAYLDGHRAITLRDGRWTQAFLPLAQWAGLGDAWMETDSAGERYRYHLGPYRKHRGHSEEVRRSASAVVAESCES